MPGLRYAFAVLMLVTLIPDVSDACLFCNPARRGLFDRCGTGGCATPCMTGQCFAPAPVIQQPCMVPQQVTTYQDVPHTTYRQEPVCTTVPVTTMRQVTVDEGSYQQVWIPRMVTRSVPQTTYQQQMSYRTVPVTTMTRVPVTSTQMVPMAPTCAPTCAAPMFSAPGCAAPSCATPFGGGMIIPGDLPGAAPATPTPYGMPSVPGATPTPAAPSGTGPVLLPPNGLGAQGMNYNPPSNIASPIAPVPTAQEPMFEGAPQTGAGDWNSIERRAAHFQQQFGYRPFGNPAGNTAVQQVGYQR